MVIFSDEYFEEIGSLSTVSSVLERGGAIAGDPLMALGDAAESVLESAGSGGIGFDAHWFDSGFDWVDEELASFAPLGVSAGGSGAKGGFTLASLPSLGLGADGAFAFALDTAAQFLSDLDDAEIPLTSPAITGVGPEASALTVVMERDRGTFKLFQDNASVDFYLWNETLLDITAPTYVITHGWRSDGQTSKEFQDLARSIEGYAPDANIVFTNWLDLANDINYADAADDTLTAGAVLSNFLRGSGLNPTTTTLIGHSLGAHVSGIAGDLYDDLTGMSIGQVIGLDPAGPLFEPPAGRGTRERLDATDGDRVIAFHTSRILGYDGRLADLDLYVNWEDWLQPGQWSFIGNHNYPIELLTELYEGAGYLQPNDGSIFDLADLASLMGSVYLDTTTMV